MTNKIEKSVMGLHKCNVHICCYIILQSRTHFSWSYSGMIARPVQVKPSVSPFITLCTQFNIARLTAASCRCVCVCVVVVVAWGSEKSCESEGRCQRSTKHIHLSFFKLEEYFSHNNHLSFLCLLTSA